MALKFHTLDVFTDRRFGGNPLAVVLGADDLSDAQMQDIAREFNLSETVFVQRSTRPAHSAKMRIFTPRSEIPFAGHPTIGTASLLAELNAPAHNGEKDALVILEQGIGTVRVGARFRAGAAAFAEFDAPKLPAEAGTLPPDDVLAAGLGLSPSEVGFENHKPLCYAAGATFAFVPVVSLEAIGRAHVNGAHWEKAFEQQGVSGAYLYTRQCEHMGSAFHVRMFAPQVGIPEDPATGSAAVGLAGLVHQFDRLPDGTHKRVVEQGYEMGRPSQIVLTLSVDGGKLTSVRIGGSSVRVSEGTIEV
jgi:trans-2,3-dihydro-3-hydroxyanthranilate isomerase